MVTVEGRVVEKEDRVGCRKPDKAGGRRTLSFPHTSAPNSSRLEGRGWEVRSTAGRVVVDKQPNVTTLVRIHFNTARFTHTGSPRLRIVWLAGARSRRRAGGAAAGGLPGSR